MGKNDVSNYPVQGSAFHCLLWPFIELDKISLKEKWDSRLIGQIHDAMLYDMNPDEREDVIAVTAVMVRSALLMLAVVAVVSLTV